LQLTGIQLAEAIRAYPEHYGHAWAIFWDYKCEIEGRGESILDDQHRWQTALQLLAYLCCFGMGRASTHLTDITVDGLADVLAHVEPQAYAALRAARFEHFDDGYEKALVAVWRQLSAALKQWEVSTTDTMLTKMLMGLWGEIPAFDKYFRATYQRVFGHWRAARTMNILRPLWQAYRQEWKPALDALGDEFTHTRRGHHNPIPVARLIDMGFWYLSYTKQLD